LVFYVRLGTTISFPAADGRPRAAPGIARRRYVSVVVRFWTPDFVGRVPRAQAIA